MPDTNIESPGGQPPITSQVRRVWNWLTAPSSQIEGIEERQKSQLLAAILLVLSVIGIAFELSALTFELMRGGVPTFPDVITIVVIALLLGLYRLSRTYGYRAAGVITILILIVGIVGQVPSASNDTRLPTIDFLIIPILIAGMLFPIRIIIGVAAANLLLIVALGIAIPAISTQVLLPISFMIAISVLVIILIKHHSLIEDERQRALKASEARYRNLVEQLPEMVIVHRDGHYLYINPAGVVLLGASSPDELIGQPIARFLHPDDRDQIVAQSKEVKADERLREIKVIRLDGTVIDIERKATVIDYFGRPAIQVIGRDITRRKQVEQEMRQLRMGVERSGEAIFMTDLDGNITYVNPGFERIYGYKREEVIGKTPRILKSGTLSSEVYESFWKMLTTGHVVYGEITNRTSDGSLIDVESIVSPVEDEDDKVIGYLAIQHDISERKRSEEALRYYASRLEILHSIHQAMIGEQAPAEIASAALKQLKEIAPFPRASVALFDLDAHQSYILAVIGAENTRYPSGLSVPLGELDVNKLKRGEHIISRLRDVEPPTEIDQQLLKEGVEVLISIPLISRGELIGSLNLGILAEPDLSDQVIQMLREIADQLAIAIQDARLRETLQQHSDQLEELVDERTSEALHAKERAEEILNSAPDTMLLLGLNGQIESANRFFVTTFYYEADELNGEPVTSLILEQERNVLENVVQEAANKDRAVRLQVKAKRKDDSLFDADIALAPIHEGGEITGLVCSLRDISRLKELDRLKDEFVSSVSHELRTPITSLKLYHHLMTMNPKKSASYMDRMQREMSRLEDIVEGLLMFGNLDQRLESLEIVPIDLNSVVRAYVNDRGLLAYSNKRNLAFLPATDLPPVLADSALIGQVVGIIMNNALTYAPVGGSVHILTHNDSNQTPLRVGVTIADTGPGIHPEDRPHLFERFYRGSASHSNETPGTGVGLAIAKEIVERHSGEIEVDSEEYRPAGFDGAVFTVWLPIAPQPASESTA